MVADGRHNNQPKMGRCGGEENGKEGRKGVGAGWQCAVSASKEGERWHIVHLRIVCVSTKLVAPVSLTSLLETRLPCYSSIK